MIKSALPYLTFDGNCDEALSFYEEIFERLYKRSFALGRKSEFFFFSKSKKKFFTSIGKKEL